MKETEAQVICYTPRGRPVAWALNGKVFQIELSTIGTEWADYEDWVQLTFDFDL